MSTLIYGYKSVCHRAEKLLEEFMSHTEEYCSKMFILALFIEAETWEQILFQERGMTMQIMLYSLGGEECIH